MIDSLTEIWLRLKVLEFVLSMSVLVAVVVGAGIYFLWSRIRRFRAERRRRRKFRG